jgi:hypothetical protein
VLKTLPMSSIHPDASTPGATPAPPTVVRYTGADWMGRHSEAPPALCPFLVLSSQELVLQCLAPERQLPVRAHPGGGRSDA